MNATIPPPRLRLIGAPALIGDRREPFRAERRYRLAVHLALNPAGARRAEVAALFWPERPEASARSNLRKLLGELKALDLPGMDLDGDLLSWSVASDARELLDGQGLPGHRAWAEPLHGMDGSGSGAYERWLAEVREQLWHAWRDFLLDARRSRSPSDALADARALLAVDPSDAAALDLATRALRAMGRDAEIATLTEQTRKRAADDLGLDRPDAEKARAGTADPTFTGREIELERIEHLLREGETRLLTIVGPGGMGKSTLMLEVLRQGVPGAQALTWIALEDLDRLDQVPPRIARELGIVVGPASDGSAEVVAALDGRDVVLLFDNAEHLAGLPALIERLLRGLPRLRCVVTSRRRLAVAGELPLPLPPMSADAARRLFVEACRQAPSKRPVSPDDPAVDALLERLGRLPLAVRLAAAWTRHMPVSTLLDQIERDPDALEVDSSVDEHPAHFGLRATFDRSWRLLDPPLRLVLASLAVCVGPVPIEVARAVADARTSQIWALADASLVEIDADGRVAMHPIVRRFADQRLGADADAREAALDRHARVYASRVSRWKEFDDVDSAEAVRAIAPDAGNVELALRTALRRRHAEWLDDLVPAYSNYWQAQGNVRRILPLVAEAEAVLAARASAVPIALCRVALERSALLFWLAEYATAERSLRIALRAARSARLARPLRSALSGLGLCAMRRGRSREGATWLGRALAQARRDGVPGDIAIFAGNLAGVLRELGELERAEALARESLEGHRASGNAIGESSVLNELAMIAHDRDRLDDAYAWSEMAFEVTDRNHMALRRPVSLTHLASVRLDQGRMDEALALAIQSCAEVERVGARSHEPTMRRILGEILLAQGRPADAAAQLRLAVAIGLEPESGTTACGVLWSCVRYAAARGDVATAWLLVHRAELHRQAGIALRVRYVRLRGALPPDPLGSARADEARSMSPDALRERLARLLR